MTHVGILDEFACDAVLGHEEHTPQRDGHISRETFLSLLLDVAEDELVERAELSQRLVVGGLGGRGGVEVGFGRREVGFESGGRRDSAMSRVNEVSSERETGGLTAGRGRCA